MDTSLLYIIPCVAILAFVVSRKCFQIRIPICYRHRLTSIRAVLVMYKCKWSARSQRDDSYMMQGV